MDIVSPLLAKAASYWKVIAAAVVLGVVAYFLYRKYSSSTQGFATMGGECNPQIENSCGKGAICQSDESGVKGVCFPLPEEEGEEAKKEVVEIASANEEGAPEQETQVEEESSS